MQWLITRLFFLFILESVTCYREPVIVIQGGTDGVNISRVKDRAQGVKRAAIAGYKIMKNGGSSTDAVEGAVKSMEEDEHFNAGYGSSLNLNGQVEMDACIMMGVNLSSGAVTGIKNVIHPVSAARLVMERSSHFLLVGEGANSFARDNGMSFAVANALITERARQDLADYLKIQSTRGNPTWIGSGCAAAVAVDSNGHVAAATSTGGQVGKWPGRVGDSALVGAGIYADDAIGAVAMTEPVVLVHGGADNVNKQRIELRSEGVKKAAMLGYKILKKGGSVVDAVEAAVNVMEDDVNFNAGYGCSLNVAGEPQLDAGIMLGSNLSVGAVSAVQTVQHPISVARLVMEESPHILLAAEGAQDFAKDHGVPVVSPKSLIAPHAHQELAELLATGPRDIHNSVRLEFGCGSVGAVAIDAQGRLAAASSTGGRVAKLSGRASDACVPGSGFYADDEVGAVVVTGHGEAIARYVMAHEIIDAMRRGFDPSVATRNVVKGITEKFHKPTGAITVSKNGQIGISFTTEKMAWAYQLRDHVHYGVDDFDHFSEKIKL